MENESIGIDAIFIAAQHDKCSWAPSIVSASSLCRALYNEESAWCGFARVSRGPHFRTSLMFHAKENNVQRLKFLIARGPRVNLLNVADSRGRTALHWAAAKNAVEAAIILCESGARLEALMDNECTALHIAANNGHFEMTKALLHQAAKNMPSLINMQTLRGSSALSFACDDNFIDIARLLLENGADPDNCDLCRPLHIASQTSPKMVKLLLNYGADVSALSFSGLTALHKAADSNSSNLKCIDILIKNGADINAMTPMTRATPLLYATKYKIIKKLCELGADTNASDFLGHSAIFQCISTVEDPKTFKVLLNHGANIEAETVTGLRPLYVAAQNGHDWAVDGLLKAGADVNPGRYNPLHIATYFGYTKCVAILLNHGAPIGVKDDDNNEVLFTAAASGHYDIVKMLLEFGANPNAMGTRTALDVAIEYGFSNIVDILISHSASVHFGSVVEPWRAHDLPYSKMRTTLYTAAKFNRVDVIEKLIAHDADVNGQLTPDPDAINLHWSPLFVACARGSYDAAVSLLAFGARKNFCNSKQISPLSVAITNRHINICKLLLESGADPNLCRPIIMVSRSGNIAAARELIKAGVDLNVTDEFGRTPLLLAVGFNFGFLSMAFLNAGANPNVRDHDLMSPLYLAAKMKQTCVIKKMVAMGANVNIKIANGFGPLHIAADLGHASIVKVLLDAGADRDAEPWASTIKAIDLAKSSGHKRVVELLKDK